MGGRGVEGDETFIGGDNFSLEAGENRASINISMGLPAHGVCTVCARFWNVLSLNVPTSADKTLQGEGSRNEGLHLGGVGGQNCASLAFSNFAEIFFLKS